MARIVSGLGPEEVGRFYLAGTEQGLARASDIQRQRERAQARAMESLAQVHEGLAKQAELDAKAKEKALQAAQDARDAGLVGKAQQIASQVQAGTRKPTDQMIEMGQRWISKIKDPVERDKFAKTLGTVVQARRAEESYQAAGESIDRAVQDGIIPDESVAQDYKSRLQAKQQRGEPADDIATELTKQRMDQAAKATFQQENDQAFQRAQALFDSLPDGLKKRELQLMLNGYAQSPSLQEQKGAGQRILASTQKAIAREEPGGLAGIPGQPGVTREDFQQGDTMGGGAGGYTRALFGMDEPQTFSKSDYKQKHGSKQRKELEKRYPVLKEQGATNTFRSLFNESKSPEDFFRSAQQQGLDLEDPEVQKAMLEAIGEQ